jgi:hypothetical protein
MSGSSFYKLVSGAVPVCTVDGAALNKKWVGFRLKEDETCGSLRRTESQTTVDLGRHRLAAHNKVATKSLGAAVGTGNGEKFGQNSGTGTCAPGTALQPRPYAPNS